MPSSITANNFFPVLPNFPTVPPAYNSVFPFYSTPSLQYPVSSYAQNSASHFNSYFNGFINGNAFQPTSNTSAAAAMSAAFQTPSSQLMAAALSNPATAAATLAMLSANSVANVVTSTPLAIPSSTSNPFTQAATAMAVAAASTFKTPSPTISTSSLMAPSVTLTSNLPSTKNLMPNNGS